MFAFMVWALEIWKFHFILNKKYQKIFEKNIFSDCSPNNYEKRRNSNKESKDKFKKQK